MIILVGPSASGKSVVAKEMIEKYGFKKMVTYTTRDMRTGEKNGVDYHFITKNEFLLKKQKDFFLETAYYNNNYYGTAYDDISKEKILIVEPNGANTYYEKLQDKVFIVYLQAGNEERKRRMIERGDSQDSIAKRLKGDVQYFALSNFHKIDYIVETDDLTISEVAEIIYNKYKELFI